jgi:hypothetical protein
MVPEPSIMYTPRPDATPEAELSALAAVYEFALRSKNAAALEPDNRHDVNLAGEGRRAHDLTEASTKELSTRKARQTKEVRKWA